MRELLCHRPVHVLEIGPRDCACLALACAVQSHFKADIEAMTARMTKIRQRLGRLFRLSAPERLQRVKWHDPRRNCRGESLRIKWSERHVFPLLDIAGTPVVEKHHAKDVRFGLFTRNRVAEGSV